MRFDASLQRWAVSRGLRVHPGIPETFPKYADLEGTIRAATRPSGAANPDIEAGKLWRDHS